MQIEAYRRRHCFGEKENAIPFDGFSLKIEHLPEAYL